MQNISAFVLLEYSNVKFVYKNNIEFWSAKLTSRGMRVKDCMRPALMLEGKLMQEYRVDVPVIEI
jgi:hypothetical protein